MVEMAIVLTAFLTLVMGMLDLGMGVFRYNTISQAARQGARQAIVHGSMADALGPWGSATRTISDFSTAPSDATDKGIYDAIRPSLASFNLSEVTATVEWIDGGNRPDLEHRVRVTVSAPYRPIMTFIFGNPTYTLSASSTMAIAH